MIRKCHICDKQCPTRYYIAEWQKIYIDPLPLAHCEECAKSRNDLILYNDYIEETERGCRLAPANIAELC